jgi:hypothetical protein
MDTKAPCPQIKLRPCVKIYNYKKLCRTVYLHVSGAAKKQIFKGPHGYHPRIFRKPVPSPG